MTDSEILQEILSRLTGLEDGQRRLEDGQRKLADGQRELEDGQRKLEDGQQQIEGRVGRLERIADGQQGWFHTLAQKIDSLENAVRTMCGELGEMRDLMAHLGEDDIVNRRAIAGVSNEVDALKERVGRIEQSTG